MTRIFFPIRLLTGFLGVAMGVWPQEPDPVRALVEAGALPRARLADLEAGQADQADEQVLRRWLYGPVAVADLTEQQSRQLVEAAMRRTERQVARVERMRYLVSEGAAPRVALLPLEEELTRREQARLLALERVRLFEEIASGVRAERDMAARAPERESRPAEQFRGAGGLTAAQWRRLALAYEREFRRPLPVSARGDTALHRSMGLNHTGRVDVGLNPDQPEGVWLRAYLERARIPYFAFRQRIPGRSTAPHIHVGPPSTPYAPAD